MDYSKIAEEIYLKKLYQIGREKKEKEGSRDNYVYVAKVDGEIKYVGRGKGDRLKHVDSGISHVYELNRDHFLGRCIEVGVMVNGLSLEEAKIVEKDYIRSFSLIHNLYNKQG